MHPTVAHPHTSRSPITDTAGDAAAMAALLAVLAAGPREAVELLDELRHITADRFTAQADIDKLAGESAATGARLRLSAARAVADSANMHASEQQPVADRMARMIAMHEAQAEASLAPMLARLEHLLNGEARALRLAARFVPGGAATANQLIAAGARDLETVQRAVADLARYGDSLALGTPGAANMLRMLAAAGDHIRLAVVAYKLAARAMTILGDLRRSARHIGSPVRHQVEDSLAGTVEALAALARAAHGFDAAAVAHYIPRAVADAASPPYLRIDPAGVPQRTPSSNPAQWGRPMPPVPASGDLPARAGAYLVAASLPSSMVRALLDSDPATWPALAAAHHAGGVGGRGGSIQAAGPAHGDVIAFAAAPVTIQAAAGSDGLPRFSMIGYTGVPVRLGGWKYPVIVDLAGMRIPSQRIPIRQNHDIDQGVGHTERVAIEGGKLHAEGVISRDTPAAREVAQAGRRGFPWQASIGASADEVEFVRDGMTAAVNGQVVNGPISVVRRSTLGEISFVDLGADGDTSATVAARGGA